jgi:hypothetical protein
MGNFAEFGFLGLLPYQPQKAGFFGLFPFDSVAPPTIPPVLGGGQSFGIPRALQPTPTRKPRQEIEEEHILTYYHNLFFWE